MELKINEVQLPEQISFNYEELKQELTEKVSMYTNLVYTEEQIPDAKKDRASLNKLKKALNDERIRLEKEYMVPFNTFKAQINEIIGIIDKPVALIDEQVKGYEEKLRQDKKTEIAVAFEMKMEDVTYSEISWLEFRQIFNEKWLNASVSMKAVIAEIDSRLEQIENDIATLSNLPEFGFEATEVYKTTLDLNKALNEGHRLSEIQKRKAEHEAEMKARAEEQARLAAEMEFHDAKSFEECMNPHVEESPVKQWVSFSALLSTEDALALKDFFNGRNIEFKAI